GRLIGMVAADAQGNHVLARLGEVQQAIGRVSSASGPLMKKWQQGVDAYYATPPQFTLAAGAFGELEATYPDFGGVALFLAAATTQTTTIPSLVTPAGSTGNDGKRGTKDTTGLSGQTLFVLASMAAATLALLIVASFLLLRRRRLRALKRAAPPPE